MGVHLSVENSIDINFVDKLSTANNFKFTEVESRMTGHDFDTIVASPS